ncbi:nicotinamide riboside transporter PnuC [Aquimarina sp. W85]|uniref:nicotinamide riboside transporter PnuC n=1 Tax=Aquimarina rhodophyticola TaxID=3342246 RepID=UPI0036711980
MNHIFEILFSQYKDYALLHIWLEIIAVFFGVLSVFFAKLNKIWVYPTGIISTGIFVYLLLQWSLLGDLLINAYYFIMSIYGWYLWSKKINNVEVVAISSTTKQEQWIQLGIGVFAVLFVYSIYQIFDKWKDWTAYIDTLTTAIFFIGMWLMAKRKIENWIYWIIGDLISIPLYFYKGFTFTSLQYVIFTVLAIFGYLSWKKSLNNTLATV